MERTKEKLDAYYTVKTHLKDYFYDRDPMSPDIQEVMKAGILLPLRDPDDKGRRVFLMRPGKGDPSKIKMTSIIKVNMMIADISLLDDDIHTIAGSVSLCDMRGMTIGHVTQMTPSLMKQTMVCFQDGYPLRPKGIHYIYSPQFFEAAFNLLKSLSKEKLRKRIFIHGDNMEEIFKVIPQRILPKEYGGDGGTTEELAMEWKSKIESYRDWFMEDKNYGVDESKRPGKPKTYEDLFGMEGSFRQLSVD
ncbi:hypothetical protein J437_LFUL015104 [Ladona fulva]|uniref:CRAL-TRIO domain-containing protein n=1 Tax=Ladona fulva TaxID=123851 RepID=A0A8K0K252_LADFU|nr:hypothetical protein J437_LFUL015104 [Ladona fulva]